jgi:hypothetical protein
MSFSCLVILFLVLQCTYILFPDRQSCINSCDIQEYFSHWPSQTNSQGTLLKTTRMSSFVSAILTSKLDYNWDMSLLLVFFLSCSSFGILLLIRSSRSKSFFVPGQSTSNKRLIENEQARQPWPVTRS